MYRQKAEEEEAEGIKKCTRILLGKRRGQDGKSRPRFGEKTKANKKQAMKM
jgi:hypothetical protein